MLLTCTFQGKREYLNLPYSSLGLPTRNLVKSIQNNHYKESLVKIRYYLSTINKVNISRSIKSYMPHI